MKQAQIPNETDAALLEVNALEQRLLILEDSAGVDKPSESYDQFMWRLSPDEVRSSYSKINNRETIRELIGVNIDIHKSKLNYYKVAIAESNKELLNAKFDRPSSFKFTCIMIVVIGMIFAYFWQHSGAAIGSALGLAFGQRWQRYLEKLKKDSLYSVEYKLNDYRQQLEILKQNGSIFSLSDYQNIEGFLDKVKLEQTIF